MASMTRATILSASALSLFTLFMGACAPEASEEGAGSDDTVGVASEDLRSDSTTRVHMMPMMTEERIAAAEAKAPDQSILAKLTYFGGPVLQNVKVVLINWNSSVPNQSTLASFYQGVTQSAYFDWLSEYNTTSPAQTIGRGSLIKTVVDTGAPTGTSITDAQIQNEIKRLISAGTVAAPDANTLFMIHFPAGVSISAPDGSKSCVVFCAYHGTFVLNNKNVYYGVMPDLSGGCASGCGGNTKINNTTSVASHELIEAVTDAAVGIATVFGPPLAWYDQTNGEIGDICNAQQGTISTPTGTFTVQKEFSNKFNSCIVTPPSGGGTACAHSICTTGAALSSTCDACATKVCAADSFCCSSSWDSVCVGEVGSVCGQTC
jgi:hypothetical protein